MPQEEFLLLMQACDVFGLVKLEKGFVEAHKAALAANPIIDETIMARIPAEQTDAAEIQRLVDEEHSEGLYHNGELVGCVNRAHDIDVNLSAHVMHENIVSKASSVTALLSAVKNAGIAKELSLIHISPLPRLSMTTSPTPAATRIGWRQIGPVSDTIYRYHL